MKIDTFSNLLKEFEITAEMLYVALLMHKGDRKKLKEYSDILTQFRDKVLSEPEKERMIKVGLLEKLPNGKYRTTEKFADLFIDGDYAAVEFFNAYPSYVRNDQGKNYPLKNVDIRSFNALYKQHVKTRTEHAQLLRILQFAKENDYGFVKIDTFIRNRMYESILEDMENQIYSSNSTNIDNNF